MLLENKVVLWLLVLDILYFASDVSICKQDLRGYASHRSTGELLARTCYCTRELSVRYSKQHSTTFVACR